MARTYFVKAYRGRRACGFTQDAGTGTDYTGNPLQARCGRSRAEHETYPFKEDLNLVTKRHEYDGGSLRCEVCGEDINVGDSYKWVKPRAGSFARGVKRNRHQTCRAWQASELTSSPHLSVIYAAQENVDAQVSDIQPSTDTSDLTAIAEEAAESVREASESYRESGDAIEEGFGHPTFQSEELIEKADDVEMWADEIEDVSFDEFDGDEEDEVEVEEWFQTQIDLLNDVMGNSPV